MKKIILLCFCFLACHFSNQVKDLIQGKWYSDKSSRSYIKITENEFIVENDSPYPEDYKIIGDSLLVSGFEAKFRESANEKGYTDTSRILKVTKQILILKTDSVVVTFHK